ncbi:MAG TPA: PAS domain S-box protein [Verrucomicrobiae bacterium]|nr:PAS domain S-box protein [Verrucomicrobiae bacterium]
MQSGEWSMMESQSPYRKLMELSPDPIVIHHQGKIVVANTAAARLTGFKEPADLLGQPVMQFLHPDYRDAAAERMIKAIHENKPGPYLEEKLILPDGKVVDVEISATPFDYLGQTAVQVIVRDLSERKKLEQEFLNNSKLESLGVLAGGLAHDFNNILTIILGNISMALVNLAPENPVYRRLLEIETAALEARDLTSQLLTFAKGGLPIKKCVAVGGFVKDAVTFALSGANIVCDFEIADNLWLVEIDDGQINQVINNVVINAKQAMPRGGVIKVRVQNTRTFERETKRRRRFVKITLSDTGPGISAEHQAKIFDPYFTTKPEGNGLGLATAYAIIKKHEGSISVVSECGKGATFEILLPAARRAKLVERQQENTPLEGVGNILVIENDNKIQGILHQMLTHLGYWAVFAREGKEGLLTYQRAIAEGKNFDAVIMDLTVPGGLGGKEAIKLFKDLDPDVKAIVSSGYTKDVVMANFQQHGFAGCVAKPFKIEELAAVLHKTLQGN